jgi:hypothetical protein
MFTATTKYFTRNTTTSIRYKFFGDDLSSLSGFFRKKTFRGNEELYE